MDVCFSEVRKYLKKEAFFGQYLKQVLDRVTLYYVGAFVATTNLTPVQYPSLAEWIKDDAKQILDYFMDESENSPNFTRWVKKEVINRRLKRLELLADILAADDEFFSLHYDGMIDLYTGPCNAEAIFGAILDKRTEIDNNGKRQYMEDFKKKEKEHRDKNKNKPVDQPALNSTESVHSDQCRVS